MTTMRSIPLRAALFVLAGTLLAVDYGRAEEPMKLGFVRSAEILANYDEVKGAEAQLQQEVEVWRREAADMKKELDERIQAYQSKQAMLSEEARAREEEEIKRKQVALEEYVQRYFGPEGKASQRNTELLQPIEDAVIEAIKVVAKREGYAMVFDASNGGVVWADGVYDLTDLVIEELNSAKSGDGN